MSEPKQESSIRVLLLDEQALFRAGLSRLLASQPGLEVIGDCGSAAEALEILGVSSVDVVLLDFDHATEGRFISEARRKGYGGRFLIVAGVADAGNSAMAIKLGASGIFLKSEAPDRLLQALTLVSNGAVWLEQKTVQMLANQSVDRLSQLNGEKCGRLLSDREQKVLVGILAGLTNKKIGNNLGLSEGSVKASVQQLFHKAGVRTRSQLVRAALEGSLGAANGLIRQTRMLASTVNPFEGRRGVLTGDNLAASRQPKG